MIVIRYVIMPDLIAFSIGNIDYILEHNTNIPRTPYTIIEVGGIRYGVNNINEWLGLKTKSYYNLELLYDLANAFIMGRESSYDQNDLEKCTELVFDHVRTMLFKDGLAGRYVEIYDIECMSVDEIKDCLVCADSVGVSQDRVHRFIRVCKKNGWIDIANDWGEYLDGKISDEIINTMQDPIVNGVISRNIRRLVASTFTKDADYIKAIENICK